MHLLVIFNCAFLLQTAESGYECLVHLTAPSIRIPATRLDQNTVVCDTFQVTVPRSFLTLYCFRICFWSLLIDLYCLLLVCMSNHNWSARKQRLHLQSAAGISRHSALSEDRIRQCGRSSEFCCKDTDQCLEVAISFCRHHSVPDPCENGSVESREYCCRVGQNLYCNSVCNNFIRFYLLLTVMCSSRMKPMSRWRLLV